MVNGREVKWNFLLWTTPGPLTPDDGDYATCMKGFPKPASKQHPRSFEHKLEQEWNVHLVNAPIKAPSGPGAGFIVIRPGDPQKSLPDESSKSQPAKIQCSTQFSEIIFDRPSSSSCILGRHVLYMLGRTRGDLGF